MATSYRGLSGINEFKNNFTSVRPTLFRVSMGIEQAEPFITQKYLNGKENLLYFYCKSATLPSSTLGEIPVPFMGRNFYEYGDREFDPWEITCYNSQDFAVRSFFEHWMNGMNLHQENRETYNGGANGGIFRGGVGNYFNYFIDFKVEQLDRRNNVIYTYNMVNAFPTRCGEIQLDYGQQNSIEEFPVTLRYQYWSSEDAEGNAVTSAPSSEMSDTATGITGLGTFAV